MFQSLLAYSESKDDTDNAACQDVQRFVEHLQDFAFYDDLQSVMSKDGYAMTTLSPRRQYQELCDYLLKLPLYVLFFSLLLLCWKSGSRKSKLAFDRFVRPVAVESVD
jgi:hypothetical protein